MEQELQKLHIGQRRGRLAIYGMIVLLAILVFGLVVTTQRLNQEQAMVTNSQANYSSQGSTNQTLPNNFQNGTNNDTLRSSDDSSTSNNQVNACSNISIVPDKYGPLGCFWVDGVYQIRVNCGNGFKTIPKERIKEIFGNDIKCIANFGEPYDKLKELAKETCECDKDSCKDRGCSVEEVYQDIIGINEPLQGKPCDPGNGEEGYTKWGFACKIHCSTLGGPRIFAENYGVSCLSRSYAEKIANTYCSDIRKMFEDYFKDESQEGFFCNIDSTYQATDMCSYLKNYWKFATGSESPYSCECTPMNDPNNPHLRKCCINKEIMKAPFSCQ